MLRLLIAEDNIDVCEGLKNTVNWPELGFEICGIATDGGQACEMAADLEPDLILLDICMPKLSGIEVLKYVKATQTPPEVIILSGHGEFSYARDAMHYGAADYLLKPFNVYELTEAVVKINKKIITARTLNADIFKIQKEVPRLKQKLLSDILSGDNCGWQEMFLEYGIQLSGNPVYIILNYPESGKEKKSDSVRLAKMLKNTAQTVAGYMNGEVFFHEGYITIIAEPDFNQNNWYTQLEKVIFCVKEELERLTGQYVSQGISNETAGTENWKTAFLQAKTAIETRFAYGKGLSFMYKDVEPLLKLTWRYPFEFRDQILKSILYNDVRERKKAVEEFINELSKISVQRNAVINAVYSLWFSLCDFAKENGLKWESVFGNKLERFLHLRELDIFDEICDETMKIIEELALLFARHNSFSSVIKQTAAYVRKNYAQDLNLNIIASHVFVSPSYLSKLFKKETGCNLNNYIYKIRIEEACKKLRDTGLKIYEIAESTGFKDEKYFFAVFKKHMNTTPQKYRKSLNPDSFKAP